MSVESNNPLYVITSLPDHDNIKTSMLNFFEDDDNYCSFQNIYRTDWHLPMDYQRNYYYAMSPIIQCLTETYTKLGYSRIKFVGYWFQQYRHDDRHDWHVHTGINFTNVYFIEAPAGTSTEIMNPLDKTIVVPTIKEGDILTFPAHLIHRSPPNRSGGRKTILALNVNVDYKS